MTSETTRKARISLAPAERKQQLLDAAREIILQDDGTDLTVERVTNAAKMAKGTFYLYFDSKDHLLGCLWDNYVNGLIDQAQQLISDALASGWAAAIDISVEQMVHYDMGNAALHQVMLKQASRDALGLFDQANQKILELLRAAVMQGVADGEFHVRNPEMTAGLLFHAGNGLLVSAHVGNHPVDREVLIEALTDLTHRTLGLTDR